MFWSFVKYVIFGTGMIVWIATFFVLYAVSCWSLTAVKIQSSLLWNLREIYTVPFHLYFCFRLGNDKAFDVYSRLGTTVYDRFYGLILKILYKWE